MHTYLWKLYLIGVCLCLPGVSHGQKSHEVGLGLNLQGDLSVVYKLGLSTNTYFRATAEIPRGGFDRALESFDQGLYAAIGIERRFSITQRFKAYVGIDLGIRHRRIDGIPVSRSQYEVYPLAGFQYQLDRNILLSADIDYGWTTNRNIFHQGLGIGRVEFPRINFGLRYRLPKK